MKDPKRAKKKPKPKNTEEEKQFDDIVGALLRVPHKKHIQNQRSRKK